MDDGSALKTTVSQFEINDAGNDTLENVSANPEKLSGINSVEVVTAKGDHVSSGTEVFRGLGSSVGGVLGRTDSDTNGGKTQTLVIVSSVMLSASLVFVVLLASLLYKYKTRKVRQKIETTIQKQTW